MWSKLFKMMLIVLAVGLGPIALAQQLAPAISLRDYQLAAGDTIHIVVFQNPDLTLDSRVNEKGTITFPLIGSVSIGGLTIAGAEAKIAAALESGGFVKSPQVNINLLQIVGNQVSVLGYVNRPGSYPLPTFNTKLSQILATAGGTVLAPIPGSNTIILSGTREGKPFTRHIDIRDIYVDDHPENDVVLSAGDSIFVPKAPVFYIYGQVNRPGQVPLEPNMTVMQALATGGGLTLRGSDRRIRLTRRNGDGSLSELFPNLGDPVLPDDVVYVNESFF